MHCVNIAILMAAGKGERMRPITDHTPKPLVKIFEKSIIETIIESLLENGISEIYIVVGYLKEQFAYLTERYSNIHIIENTEYETKNNISSIYAAKELLGTCNCIIAEADLYIKDLSIIKKEFEKTAYMARYVEGKTKDWCFQVKENMIQKIQVGGEDVFNMVGISYWTKEDSSILKKAILMEYEKKGHETLYWDEIVDKNLDKIDMGIIEVDEKKICEIDTVEELEQLKSRELRCEENQWKKIWEKKGVNGEHLNRDMNFEKRVMYLKQINGFDIVENQQGSKGLTVQSIVRQFEEIYKELSENAPIKSLFEVGCGSGINLYLFQQKGKENRVGGIDYSASLINVAKENVNNAVELICGEAVQVPIEEQYDAILSNSVFSYFPNYEYALKVLELMSKKSIYSIGLLDIHDINKKDEFISYRRKIISDYDAKYKGLDKLFYSKDFFEEFAQKNNYKIKFMESNVEDYWNNEFVFNCYIYK